MVEACPMVSVIIPIYNTGRFLNECVDSVLTQSHVSLEIILVDDGSRDNSAAICDIYAERESRVKVVHQKNSGLSMARNTGLLLATGEYVLFLDSDDFHINDTFIQQLIEQANSSGAETILYRCTRASEDGSLDIFSKDIQYNLDVNLMDNIEQVLHCLAFNNQLSFSACNKLIKRSFLIENDLFFKPGIKSEDIEWFFRVLPYVKSIQVSNMASYCYRRREGSITHTVDKKHLDDLLTIIEDVSIRWKDTEPSVMRSVILNYVGFQHFIILGFLDKVDSATKKIYLIRLRKLKWVLPYCYSKKNKKARLLVRLVGLKLASKVLGLYIKLR